MTRLTLVPISIREASQFVAHHHRHHRPPRGALFALGADVDGTLVGVALVGRPVGRGMQDGRTVEVIRLAVDTSQCRCASADTPHDQHCPVRNACSFLYGRARRAAAALGYQRVITYTRQDESGASPRGAGYEQTALLPARSYEGQVSRPRFDRSTPATRVRWEAAA